MIRTFVFSLLSICVGFLLNVYIQNIYHTTRLPSQDMISKSSFENTQIKVYGNSGVEWIVKGSILEMQKDWITLQDPVLISNKGERIKANIAVLNRSTGLGRLERNVILESQNIYIQTDIAEVDLKNNTIRGEGSLYAKNENNIIRGKGYTIHLRPLKVIIKNVDAEIK